MITLLHSPRREMEVSFTSRGQKGKGAHGLDPSFLGKWMGCGHSHSISLPEGSRAGVTMASDLLFLEVEECGHSHSHLTSRGKQGRGEHDLRPSLIGRWMGCNHYHSISPLDEEGKG